MERDILDDLPEEPPGAVAGAQPKVLLTEKDGLLRVTGRSSVPQALQPFDIPDELLARITADAARPVPTETLLVERVRARLSEAERRLQEKEHSRPVIFLDFDGVIGINPRWGHDAVVAVINGGIDADYRKMVESVFCGAARANLTVLAEEFDPYFVVSSNWARTLSLNAISILLAATDLDMVIARLHDDWATHGAPGTPRLHNIEDWLSRNSWDRPVLVLDDQESGWSLIESRLDQQGQVILCEINEGLTAAKLEQARQILHSQLQRTKAP